MRIKPLSTCKLIAARLYDQNIAPRNTIAYYRTIADANWGLAKNETQDFARLVITALDAADIAYMIGGAVAAWAWGEPRATLDLDVVVNIPIESVSRLSNE